MRQLALGIAVIVLSAPSAASAGSITGAALAGYGFHDGYTYGAGIRGGFTFPAHLYLGGTVIAHAGRTGTRTEQSSIPETDLWYLGGEAGWDITAGPVTVRPYLGIGSALIRSTNLPICLPPPNPCIEPQMEARAEVALWPGAAVLLTADTVFVGADIRYVVLPGSDYADSLGAFGTLGLSL